MSGSRGAGTRVGLGALLSLVAVTGSVACSALYGFHDPIHDDCILDASACAPPAASTVPSCAGACGAPGCAPCTPGGDRDAARLSPPQEAGVDVTPPNDASPPDGSSEGLEGGCPSPCDGGVCIEALCRGVTSFGYGRTGNEYAPVPGNTALAVQVRVPSAGWVVGIGVGFTQADPATLNLALYRDDGGGHPGALVAAAAPLVDVLPDASGAVTSTTPAVPLTADYYWILVATKDHLVMNVNAGPPVAWAYGALPFGALTEGTASSLPAAQAQEPNVFVYVAQQ